MRQEQACATLGACTATTLPFPMTLPLTGTLMLTRTLPRAPTPARTVSRTGRTGPPTRRSP